MSVIVGTKHQSIAFIVRDRQMIKGSFKKDDIFINNYKN
jgi:hypothetical protein